MSSEGDVSDSGHSVFHPTPRALGEGPTYDPDTRTVWWFDIVGKKLLEKRLADDTAVVHDLPVMASAMAVIDGDRHLMVCEDGLHIRNPATGALSLLTPLEADNPITRSNDSRVHPSGAFWIGTMGKNAEPGAGAIYHFFKGTVRRLYRDITVPNAICFSADGATGYFTDTPTGRVMRVVLDPATGLPQAEPTVFLDRNADHAGHADGAVIDADGLFWNARWEGHCLSAFDPSGALVESIALPVSRVTCPAFVDGDRMIVTSAFTGLSDDERAGQPHAGRTFLLERTFRGRHEPKVLL